ncbi:ABC transporter ATP-binding protein [Fusibacter paucivorans]|uniref:ABC transporter ATP-binding protein n=1 Tax=Fusibacter paucivorans TaxID=76009 RepID=A0ABS5PJC7_9FIRM|nr:ABC transporter ATP-binding protein [Fusibacter paucivorans]MBS7525203.1 ABC transporter ATP-binding protein [Fusibacter paucivorans]
MIAVDSLTFQYGKRPVLKSVSFTVRSGEMVALLGPNGVGKSTLFRCLLGFTKHYEGTVRIGGKDIKRLSPQQLAQQVAYIPQSHISTFSYTVLEMVVMGLASSIPKYSVPDKGAYQRALEALTMMALEDYANRQFNQLSGGEQQMILIARALAQHSKVILMDEPTSNLDYGNQLRVLKRVNALKQEGYTIVISSHNPQHALMFSDRVIALHNGRVLAMGEPKTIVDASLIETLYKEPVEMIAIGDERWIKPSLERMSK